ncbi:hypothetical protein GGR25_003806 [Kaistia hirudinis]|uniref:Glycosyltransferase RgtA/B/C/D-like domain-containing protein n=1 Tax=Kaistia hirudinis TaxID=1293440 RepID=A0A840ASX0_9HYPH|nr:hypothetical protein [Kaistia hirudinis]MBB3932742.1 hypothetical protein [Kaistia hirudinis]
MKRQDAVGNHPTVVCYLAATALTGVLVFEYALATQNLNYGFPTSYTWTELLLNYQGGVIKRAALGEIAYHIDFLLPARLFILAVIVSLWVTCILSIVWVLRIFQSFAGLLFLVSPAGLLFPIYDQAAFGRKDLFVWAVAVVAAVLTTKVRNSWQSLTAILATAIGATAFSETVTFYIPLIFWGFLSTRRNESIQFRVTAALIVGAVTLLGFAVNYALKSTNESMIATSWQTLYPDAYQNAGALCCLGMNLSQALQHMAGTAAAPLPRDSYILGALLAIIPTLVLVWSRPPREPRTILGTLCLIAGLLGSLAPLALATDWGRFISLSTSVTFLATWTALSGEPFRACPSPTCPRGLSVLVGKALILVLFAGSWRMTHWRPSGESGVLPGPLLSWLGLA